MIRMNYRLLPLTALAACFGALVCHAQYHVIPGDTDENGCSGKKSARICAGSTGAEHCYAPPSEKLYTFGLEPKTIPAGQLNGQPLILFSAMFSGCGSGTLTDYSLVTIKNGEFVKLSPKIQLTDQSQHQLWQLPQISPYPVFVTADFIWDFKTETHFSHHRYVIHTYVFDQSAGQYLEELHFETTRKYPGEDDGVKLNVLESEKSSIISQLQHPRG
jgi:hypothetical protein